VHGTPRNCSSITQLDSALSANFQGFFAGWSEQDYRDAIAWSQACAEFGWHVPGHPRIALLQAEHDKALGKAAVPEEPARATAPPNSRAAPDPLPSPRRPADTLARPLSAAEAVVTPRSKAADSLPVPTSRSPLPLPADGSPVIGANTTVISRYRDTLFDIARRYGLGFEELMHANPGVDIWLPGEGTRILLPGRRILPPGSREGIVVNLPEHRLYYFPKPGKNEQAVVITYPVSIGKAGDGTPLGQTTITAKVEHPSWVPTDSIRKEHASRGDPLPRVIAPGPDNPIGQFKMRLGFGNGTYEIHGTNRPGTIGTAATYGCIAMYPEDLAALYALISVGTPVRLINVPVKIAWSAGRLLVEAHPAVDLQGQSKAPTIDELADVLRATATDARVSILWERAREALEKADGVIATVGTRL
jgi:L,D-transpeptidase ErfK/SrfK